MSRPVRWLVALTGLWGGVLAWVQVTRPERARVEQLTYTDAAPPASATDSPLTWSTPRSIPVEQQKIRRDLFAAADRPTARKRVPTPTPEPARPLPELTFSGFLVHDGVQQVLLSDGEKLHRVTTGDILPGGWRVEKTEENRVVLRHASGQPEFALERK